MILLKSFPVMGDIQEIIQKFIKSSFQYKKHLWRGSFESLKVTQMRL